MADQLLNVNIRINKETGALELVNQQVGQFKKNVDESTASLDKLYKAAVAFGAAAFLKSAIKDAVDYEHTLDLLETQMRSLGIQTKGTREDVIRWSESIQAATRFSNDQAIGAVSKLVGATKDLATAQRLAQIAMDVSVGSGKDFNEVLDNIEKAYIGNERGVRALKDTLGNHNLVVKDTNQLLELLESRWDGAAAAEAGHSVEIQKQVNHFNDLKRSIGESLLPAVTLVAKGVDLAIRGIMEMGVVQKTIIADIVANFKFLGEAIKLALHGQFDEIGEKWKQTQDKMTANHETAIKEIDALDRKHTDNLGNELKKQGNLKAQQSTKDLAAEEKVLNERLKLIQANTEAELQKVNLTSSQRIAILKDGLNQEIKAVNDAVQSGVTRREEGNTKIEVLTAETNKKIVAINQKAADDSAARWEEFTRKVASQNQILEKELETVFDGIAGGFGDSVAKMIVHGESFRKNFGDAMKQLAEELIAQFVRLELQLLVLQPLARSFNGLLGIGGGGGGLAANIGGQLAGGAIAGVGGAAGGTAGVGGVVSAGGGGAAAGAGGVPVIQSALGGIAQVGPAALLAYALMQDATSRAERENEALRQQIADLQASYAIAITKQGYGGALEASRDYTQAVVASLPPEVQEEIAKNTSLPKFQVFAERGVVTKPTLALIGEAGPEVVTPLGQKSTAMGGISISMPTTIQIMVNAGTTEAMAREIVSAVAEQLKKKTPEAINLAIRSQNLVNNFGGRAA